MIVWAVMVASVSDNYFKRFAFCGRQIAQAPRPDLGIVVVIPCFNEPDLIGSLESLRACQLPECSVDIIVVINSSRDSDAAIRLQNKLTLAQAAEWISTHADLRFAVHLLHFPDLPPKQAGVGLARKVGMDEALLRFEDVGKPQGIIVCFDADCRCEQNYLVSIEDHFGKNPRSPGCSIYFEHPLSGPLDEEIYEAVAAYELHLRYYVQALRYSGFPYAYHTVGSCMAVRAEAYKKQGGMNRRQAGEDFYFLHKIIPLGGFTNLNTTIVVPSPRASERVPFGTGNAVSAYLRQGRKSTYPLQGFLDLKVLFEQLPVLYCSKGFSEFASGASLPGSVGTFLNDQHFAGALTEIRQNTSGEAAFRKRFFHWFNGFQAMKFIHHARDRFYGEVRVEQASRDVLALLPDAHGAASNLSIVELLKIYRRLDRAC